MEGWNRHKFTPAAGILGGYTLGALVQSNFGGVLQMDGIAVGRELGQYYLKDELGDASADGSIMILIRDRRTVI